MLNYSLVVKEGMVRNICKVPEEIPEGGVAEIADVAMRIHESMRTSLFGVDFESGILWCHAAFPVAAIPEESECPQRNMYGALVKLALVMNIARLSNDIHSAIVDLSRQADDDATEKDVQE